MNSKKVLIWLSILIFLLNGFLGIHHLSYALEGSYIELRGVKLIENNQISTNVKTGASNIPLTPSFKINFSNGIYRVQDHDLKYIHLYDLDNNEQKVQVNLQVLAPGTYGDFFEEKERWNEGNINKSRSILMTSVQPLRENGHYRIFISKEVKANNTLHLKDDVKIDFTTTGGKASNQAPKDSNTINQVQTDSLNPDIIAEESNDNPEKPEPPSFTRAVWNANEETIILKGLPKDANNLEYRISIDGENFSEWKNINADKNGTAQVEGVSTIQEGISKAEVRLVENEQFSDSVEKIIEKDSLEEDVDKKGENISKETNKKDLINKKTKFPVPVIVISFSSLGGILFWLLKRYNVL